MSSRPFCFKRRWRPTMIANSSRLLDLTIDDSLAYPDLTALPVGVFMRMCVWLPSSSAPMTPIFSERRSIECLKSRCSILSQLLNGRKLPSHLQHKKQYGY
ncbi:uncharacterized protein [Bemisia tabaci]|uniref:uncharacterized protein n=1 Tax=Bemisia tabaci TaxID=7038 RepID=UPI003B282045